MDYSFTETVYIIGKGPSLDLLSNKDFESGCSILCINDSIHKVYSLGLDNPIFCITQDIALGNLCKVVGPTFLIGKELVELYADHPNTIVVDIEAPKITAILAIYIAKKNGCHHCRMLCFDACVTGETGYADIIGHRPQGNEKRFLQHRNWIEDYNTNVRIEWLMPKAHLSKVDDKLQQ